MIEEKLRRYAQLKAEVKIMTEALEKLKPEIVGYLEEQKLDKLPTNLGTFSLKEHSVWKYSEAVEELQKKEKATGIAKKVVSTTLLFSPSKGDDFQDE